MEDFFCKGQSVYFLFFINLRQYCWVLHSTVPRGPSSCWVHWISGFKLPFSFLYRVTLRCSFEVNWSFWSVYTVILRAACSFRKDLQLLLFMLIFFLFILSWVLFADEPNQSAFLFQVFRSAGVWTRKKYILLIKAIFLSRRVRKYFSCWLVTSSSIFLCFFARTLRKYSSIMFFFWLTYSLRYGLNCLFSRFSLLKFLRKF